MKTCKYKTGFTLVEMLVVIAIVAVLATMVISVASRIETREKQKHCRSILVLLSTALTQFHEYGFDYEGSYAAFDFPLDCNGFDEDGIAVVLRDALGAEDVRIWGVYDAGVVHDDVNDSSNEIMYLLLSMVPTSRETLEKIDKKLVTNLDRNGTGVEITISYGEDVKTYPLLRVLDPWGETLRYDYYDEQENSTEQMASKKTFPLITSVGPDKKFGTDDDITNR